jgi:hypothetical protein
LSFRSTINTDSSPSINACPTTAHQGSEPQLTKQQSILTSPALSKIDAAGSGASTFQLGKFTTTLDSSDEVEAIPGHRCIRSTNRKHPQVPRFIDGKPSLVFLTTIQPYNSILSDPKRLRRISFPSLQDRKPLLRYSPPNKCTGLAKRTSAQISASRCTH